MKYLPEKKTKASLKYIIIKYMYIIIYNNN
jgi:hypothetical protein